MTRVEEIMTASPACCTPETGLQEVAQMFVDNDCGAIPVVESRTSRRAVGIVTDRDIACRAIAAGKNALELTARDCMSSPCVTIFREASLEDCCDAMEANRVRRILVVDASGDCCGIVSQADISRAGKNAKVAEVVREVSEPTPSASAVR
jgi:CBS domain-containing protein